jgi:hypothetical protein
MFGIDDAIGAVASLADTVVSRVWPDATEVERAKIEMLVSEMNNEYKLLLSQIEVNKIEAGSSQWFSSNWRPFVGWVCAIALGYSAVIDPFLRFTAAVIFGYTGTFPVLDTSITGQILTGLLGLGVMRSFDKKHGTIKK